MICLIMVLWWEAQQSFRKKRHLSCRKCPFFESCTDEHKEEEVTHECSDGIKEQIAMDLEKYGDTRVVSVKEVQPEASGYEQMRLGDSRSEKH